MDIIKVQAMSRMKDISTANAKPAKGNDMVSWAESFGRSGIRFSTEKPTEITIVGGKPYPHVKEVSRHGAKMIVLEPRLKVWDNEIVRELLAEALAEHRAKAEYGLDGNPKPFIHALVISEGGEQVEDDTLPGQEIVLDDGYETMTKAQLKDALLNAGFDEKEVNGLFRSGMDAMISALRGH